MSVAAAEVETGARRARVLDAVRDSVRALLERTPGFHAASPELRLAVAHKMVRVAMAGADLLAEEQALSESLAKPAPLAAAQAAGDQLGLQSARASGATIAALKNAIDFPTFVTSLINGVFQAITSSSVTQLASLSDLLDNVSASAESFTDQNVRDGDVVNWAVGRFPFLIRGEEGTLSVREGADLQDKKEALKDALGATDGEVGGIDEGDLMATLGPLVRRRMGRDKQQILGTLVQLGLQRIVVDEGRLHASMDMRVDTSSVSEEDKANRSDFGVEAKASGSFGVGPWSASASVGTSFSKVESDQQYTKEELATRASLRSSVDLAFRTEQIPLDRMANEKARVKLDANARVPANVTEGSLISTERRAGIVPESTHRPSLDTPPPRPAAKEPAAKKPAGKEPAAKEPAAGKPSAGKPDANKTAAGKPQAPGKQPASGTKPGAAAPASSKTPPAAPAPAAAEGG